MSQAYEISHLLAGVMLVTSFALLYQERVAAVLNAFAAQSVTLALAVAWAPEGIRVNAIAPGWIETDMTAPVRTTPMKLMNDEILARTPAGRWGQPEEVAGTAVFLASRASDFVTGATIFVDGGYAIR